MNKNLPEGWAWTILGEIAFRLQAGGTPSTKVKAYYENGTINYVKIEDMASANKYLFDTKIKITKLGLDNCSAWMVPENSLLYSMYASYGIPVINKIKVATNQAIIAFIPREELINLDYIYYYLLFIKPFLKYRIRGTTQENLNANIVTNIEIPLPPLAEQQRIVNKIEELFTNLDKGIEYLKTAQTELKLTRQSVLKYAMEGKLTEKWREENKDKIEPASVLLEKIKAERKKDGKYKELSPIDTTNLPELPKWWIWVQLYGIAAINPSLPDFKYHNDMEVSFIPMKAVSEVTGQVELSETKKYAEVKKGYTSFIDKDILFAKITPCMENGKIAIIDTLKNGIGFGSTEFHVIRLTKNLPRKFIFYYLVQEIFRRRAESRMTGSVGQKRVPSSYLIETVLPFPPLAEQQKIVEEIETYYSILDNMENTISQSLNQTSSVKHSILKKAFEGKLVQQDPNDEPASVLLER